MALEKRWEQVSALLTADGTTNGVAAVADASGFFAKQKVTIKSNTQPALTLEVKRVTSGSVILGDIGKSIDSRTDLSAYLIADGANLFAAEQAKPSIQPDEIFNAVYQRDPAVALRNLLVNKFGIPLDTITDMDGNVRLAVDASVTISSVSVNLDAFTKNPPDNAIAVGTEDGTKTGVKHAQKIGSDGKLEVKDTAADASLASIDGKLNSLGQKTMAGSVPVVIASDQSQIIDAFSTTPPDNAIAVGTEDGTASGTKHAVRVDNELDLRVGISDGANKAAVNGAGELSVHDADVLAQVNALIALINSVISSGAIASLAVGTEDGTDTGVQHIFVNNARQMILASHNRTAAFTYADFGTKNQRITQIDYTSPTFLGITSRRVFNYTLVGTKYRRDNEVWSIV